MTNGQFKSVRHRVMTNSEKSRMSMAYFGGPPLNAMIVALPEMVGPEKPCLYRPFTWAQYKNAAYSLRLGDTRLSLFANSTWRVCELWLNLLPPTRCFSCKNIIYRFSFPYHSLCSPSFWFCFLHEMVSSLFDDPHLVLIIICVGENWPSIYFHYGMISSNFDMSSRDFVLVSPKVFHTLEPSKLARDNLIYI